jgi:CRISPR system Cascade subunit CasA
MIALASGKAHSLPGLLAALVREEADQLRALRPHQMPAWHMFTVQLAALALAEADRQELPETENEWRGLLRGLTVAFPQDEPWCLVVEDAGRPAFLQPSVPEGVTLGNTVLAPDALDLLITSKNHDLKQAMARDAAPEDWVFALVSLQTSEGYGGAGNHGIARMNGGSSSRPLLSRAPVGTGRAQAPRPGAWFRRDVQIALQERARLLNDGSFGYSAHDGLGLTWLTPWPEDSQLAIMRLDPLFIEVCRRVRLVERAGRLMAHKGTSAAARIAAREAKGNLGDIWAPIHKAEAKSLTLGNGDFDYRRMANLLSGADWMLPASARHRPGDGAMVLVAAALARGNSRTDGYRERLIPIRAEVAELIDMKPSEVGKVSKRLIELVDKFRTSLRGALALAAAGGEGENHKKGHYRFADTATARLDRFADAQFFPLLWEVLAAGADADVPRETQALSAFVSSLWDETRRLFEVSLPAVPCKSLLRPRAEANARRLLHGSVMKAFGAYLRMPAEVSNAA